MAREKTVVKLSVSLPTDVLTWIDEKVEDHHFATRSHGITVALVELRKRMEKEKR